MGVLYRAHQATIPTRRSPNLKICNAESFLAKQAERRCAALQREGAHLDEERSTHKERGVRVFLVRTGLPDGRTSIS